MTTMRLAGLALSLLALAGCKKPREWPGPPACVLGTNVLGFTPIEPGDALPMIRGGQGGYHVWGSVLARYLAPEGVRLAYSLTFADGPSEGKPVSPEFSLEFRVNLEPMRADLWAPGARVRASDALARWEAACVTAEPTDAGLSTVPSDAAAPGEGDWSLYLGTTVFVSRPCEAHGRALRLRVTATDEDGRACSDEHTFTAYCTSACAPVIPGDAGARD